MRNVRTLFKVAAWLWLTSFGCIANAATVAGLYETEVGMAGADEQARGDAELRALEAVLVKLTGTRNVNVLAALALHDGPLRDLIERFQARGGNGDEPRRLWVRFDERQLDRLLARSQIPLWGRTRPLTAVMLAIDDGQSKRMLAAGENSGFAATLNGAAASRGIPMVLPLMDLQDARQLRPDSLLAGDDAGTRTTADRYRGEALVYGALAAKASGWQLDWTLQVGEERRDRSKKGAPNALLELLANSVADALAARFMVPLTSSEVAPAPTASQPVNASGGEQARTSSGALVSSAQAQGRDALVPSAGVVGANAAVAAQGVDANPPPPLQSLSGDGVPVEVLGVRSAYDYGKVLSYLRTLDFVEHVHVSGVQGDTLSLSVRARGGASALRQTLDIGHTLRPVAGDARAYQLR